MITALGEVEGKGENEIDAEGHIVSPGFVDLHTHLDAQIGWDSSLSPLSWHGVTTALLGNCGVTFAPCKPTDRELLAGMMETVEDIPKHLIMTGLPWTWETLHPSINLAGMVGHSAVRYFVMGERAVEEQASDSEKQQMAQIVADSIRDGAVGFSLNRYAPHMPPDGRSIPGTFADESEILEIAKRIGPLNGLVQTVGMDQALMRNVADVTGGRVLFSYGTGPEPGDGKAAAQQLDKIVADHDITGPVPGWRMRLWPGARVGGRCMVRR